MLSLLIEQETAMAGRYELSDQRWQVIEDIVSPPQAMGRPRRDDRQMLNGILWILCAGAQWRDLPDRYDKLAHSFRAMVCLACTDHCLRANFSYKTSTKGRNTKQPVHGHTRREADVRGERVNEQ
jgi:transposase